MGLNARSKRRITEGAEYLKNVLSHRGHLSSEGAKDVLRQGLIYQAVQDVTLERIGEHGVEQQWYCFDKNRGFWPVGELPPQGYIRDFVHQWTVETTEPHEKKKRGAMRDSVARILREYDDPTLDHNPVKMAQELNERTRSGTFEDKDLGSFRSFVRWGCEAGLLNGDLRLMVAPEELVTDGLRKGTVRAKIQGNSMTNTKDEWLWNVRHPDGITHQEWHTIPDMQKRIEELALLTVDDEEIDLKALMEGAGPAVDPDPNNLKSDLEKLRMHFLIGVDMVDELLKRL